MPLLGRFIADLLVPEVQLIVEIDGAITRSGRRPMSGAIGRSLGPGTDVLRLPAELVMNDLAAALGCIRAELERLRSTTTC
jgi:very-short-patch-repair endonuclease